MLERKKDETRCVKTAETQEQMLPPTNVDAKERKDVSTLLEKQHEGSTFLQLLKTSTELEGGIKVSPFIFPRGQQAQKSLDHIIPNV